MLDLVVWVILDWAVVLVLSDLAVFLDMLL